MIPSRFYRRRGHLSQLTRMVEFNLKVDIHRPPWLVFMGYPRSCESTWLFRVRTPQNCEQRSRALCLLWFRNRARDSPQKTNGWNYQACFPFKGSGRSDPRGEVLLPGLVVYPLAQSEPEIFHTLRFERSWFFGLCIIGLVCFKDVCFSIIY